MKPRAVGLALFAIWLAIVHRQLGTELREPWTYALLATLGILTGIGIAWPRASRTFATAIEKPPTWAFLLATSALAAGTTLWLALFPMRGQAASLDGTVYLFEARALANLRFGFPIPSPGLPFGIRFLFEGADGDMHGVFPIGFPLYLSPFVAIGLPVLAGPASAIAMVLAQYALTKALAKTELIARASVLLSLPSWARAIETAEPASHPLVGVLFALTLVLALRLRTTKKPFRTALALGACAGWAFSARLLDGIVLGAVLGPVLLVWAFRSRIPRLALPAIVLGTLPFVGLLLGQQYVATGSPFRPNVTEYAVRSDWPPTCLRLGIGQDIGCQVEHPLEAASFGPDGYQLDDAYRLIRERADALGPDLVGSSWLFLLAFVPLLFWNLQDAKAPRNAKEEGEDGNERAGVLLSGALLVTLTVAYGLYYYGNHPIWGARHLFPAAPFVWALIAIGIARPKARGEGEGRLFAMRGASVFAMLVTVSLSAWPMWKRGLEMVRRDQANRIDLRAVVEEAKLERGIVATFDTLGYIAGWNPWADRGRRFFVLDGSHSFHDLRALHPSFPVYEAHPPGRLVLADPPPPKPQTFWIELERAWPSFQRPEGLGAAAVQTSPHIGIRASYEHALYVFASKPRAKISIPVWIPKSGRYSVQLHSIKGPDHGDYKIMLDDHVLPLHRGYSPEHKRVASAPSVPIELEAGRHLLIAECLGKQRESTGYLAIFDVLTGAEE